MKLLQPTLLSLFALGSISYGSAQVFFTEDFEGTMDGVTDLPASWTETGLSSDGIWSTGTTGDASSSYITWPTPVSGTTFAFTNDDDCNCNKSADRMILPVQDFTGMPAVEMTADVYINGGYGESLECQVSTDGGTTWTTVQTFTPNAADWSFGTTVSLNAYAGMSNVSISFLYDDASQWAYGAGVDNLVLTETVLDNDLTPVSHNGEYTIIPLPQAASMDLIAAVYNNSATDLSDIMVDANIYIGGAFDQTITSTAASILAGDTTAVAVGAFTPTVAGDYTVEYVVSSTALGTDTDPLNDTLIYNFVVDPSVYARDEGAIEVSLGVNGTGNTAVLGALYEINALTRIDSLFASHNFLFEGDTLVYEVYTTSGGLPDVQIGVSDIYLVTAAEEIATTAAPTVAMHNMSSGDLLLSPGTYFIAYRELTSIDNGGLNMTSSIFTPNTVFAQVNGGAWETIESLGFENTPILHPVLATCDNFVVDMVSEDILCNGDANGTGMAVASGGVEGYAYQWDANAGNQITASIGGLDAGTYYVTITDTIGCTWMDSVEINEPAVLDGTATDNGDGTATASATGGTSPYTYQWDTAAGDQTTATATGLSSGTYDVTITDANGCTTTASVTIDSSVGLDELSGESDILMQPNPARDKVSISIPEDLTNPAIHIYNAAGQLVAVHAFDSNTETQEIAVGHLPAGMYSVRFSSDRTVITKRLMILK